MRFTTSLSMIIAGLIAGGAPWASVCAEDAVPTPASASAQPSPVGKPFLGVRVDKNSVAMNTEPGIPVSEVVAGSTFANLGLAAGDRLLTINGKAMKSLEDLEKSTAGAKVGDPVSIDYRRSGATEVTTASGVLVDKPRPANLSRAVDTMQKQLDEVKALADAQKREPTLAEILQQLKDIQDGMPRAIAGFKKQYPNGEFDIQITVRIVSDTTAKDPVELGPKSQRDESDKKPSDKTGDKTEKKEPAPAAKPKADAATQGKP